MLLRELWTRTGEGHHAEKQRVAQRELARELAQRLETAMWEAHRDETAGDVIWREVGSRRARPAPDGGVSSRGANAGTYHAEITASGRRPPFKHYARQGCT